MSSNPRVFVESKQNHADIYDGMPVLSLKGSLKHEKVQVEIENIVASGDLGGRIDLEIVAERLCKTMYEPEQFPGLIYYMNEPKAVLLIFASGKIVCVGAKTETDVNLAVEKLRDTLEFNEFISFTGSSSNNQGNSGELMSQVSIIQTEAR